MEYWNGGIVERIFALFFCHFAFRNPHSTLRNRSRGWSYVMDHGWPRKGKRS